VIACSGEATGVSEARLVRERMAENATREPGSPAEADGCVVKRPIPRSPSPGKQAMERERGASFEEMLGTPEARVLVNEAVGSRSRLERIVRARTVRVRMARPSQGRQDAWFCPAPQGVGPGWLKCTRVCIGRQGFRYDGRRLESFLLLLATERDSSSVRGDRGTILVSG